MAPSMRHGAPSAFAVACFAPGDAEWQSGSVAIGVPLTRWRRHRCGAVPPAAMAACRFPALNHSSAGIFGSANRQGESR